MVHGMVHGMVHEWCTGFPKVPQSGSSKFHKQILTFFKLILL